jgi:hypothetical protein
MNEFGPLRIWQLPEKRKLHHRYRWGRPNQYYSREDEISYPFCQFYGRMYLPAEGMISGLFDTYSRIDPKHRPRRAQLFKAYRAYALPRILLGEFGPVFAQYCVSTLKGFRRKQNVEGWWARVPREQSHSTLFQLFSANADHDLIRRELDSTTRWDLAGVADTQSAAVRKAIDRIGRNALDAEEWYEEVRIDHPPVNWRELV